MFCLILMFFSIKIIKQTIQEYRQCVKQFGSGLWAWFGTNRSTTWDLVCVTSKVSDQPAHTRSLIRAFASRLNILWIVSYRPNIILISKLKRRLHRLVWVYSCQNVQRFISRQQKSPQGRDMSGTYRYVWSYPTRFPSIKTLTWLGRAIHMSIGLSPRSVYNCRASSVVSVS